MSTIGIVTEEARDMGDLARAAQWARLLVDATLPLDVPPVVPGPGTVPVSIQTAEEDRTGMRAEAFAQLPAQLIEGGWTARPSDLERLTGGRMPEPRP